MIKTTSITPHPRKFALWTHGVFPLFNALVQIKYFSLEVNGIENVPRQESLIYVANHSSWLALDGFLIPYVLHRQLEEQYIPYGIIHDVLFKLPILNHFFFHCGAMPVSWVRQLKAMPHEVKSIGIFPEGDEGNSKPFWEAYQMRRWKRGFVKLSLERKARIVPIAIQGLEESMPVAFTVKSLKSRLGTLAGYPLFPFPLPSKFKITFCEPIDLSHHSEDIKNQPQILDRIAEEVRHIVQTRLDQEAGHRPLAKFSKFIKYAVKLRSSDPQI